ncbi:hypothetical protein vBPaerPsCh_196c [Pseudomonas phage vB_Paer_PsCh]|uniref:Uncharacterized protein n=1 Tax=Pseudomonas phage vB_Paer_PsCh TaxID=2924906 RepID=A0AAE9GS22_9CAUD|nr:hypothetical protein QE349_gp196 [Pseudomonas phage vB_Paer_PsCh]UOL48027.1 hypothetical protein vBPaerPsCh_196c [Pseudomonas phage vB_Paer_PsCh]
MESNHLYSVMSRGTAPASLNALAIWWSKEGIEPLAYGVRVTAG